ncbi:MAG TPA: multicopper oxidase domain-containing protein [Aquihabitans sp.]|nr:multicopper oxidase domain-containing protein [Aquihabitans sp.]
MKHPNVLVRTWRRGRLARVAVSALAVAIVAGTVATAAVAVWWRGADTSTIGTLSFANELHIPPLARSTVEADGTRVFDLTARATTASFKPGMYTDVLGYDGGYLGPTLRAERGERVRVRVRNELDEVTTTHWHGMRLPAEADGGPHAPIEPGETWAPSWTIDQPAATLWYHPHPHGRTEAQVHRGMAGMFIVDEPGAATGSLPDDYGVDDVPVIVQDRSFAADGSFRDGGRFLATSGTLGRELLVNGTWNPHHVVTTERVRLRVLNASTARVYEFGFDDDRSFDVVATDGGLLDRPVPLDRIRLSPGERAEVVVAVRPGERTVLRSTPPDLGVDPFTGRGNGGDDSFDVLELRAAAELTPAPPPATRLGTEPALDPADAVRTRRFSLDGDSTINGRPMDPARVDATVRAGSVELWEVDAGGQVHNFHVHDVQFQVVDVDGEPPPPELAGWKDTVYLGGADRIRLLMWFGDQPDPDTPFMFHCHLLAHEDGGMMGQFVVTADGRPGGPLSTDAHEGHGT